MNRIIIRNVRIISIVLAVSIINTTVFLITNILSEGELFSQLSLGPFYQFCDYFYHTAFASTGELVYQSSVDACFPPLAYCGYWILYKMAPYQPYTGLQDEWIEYANSNNAMLVFVAVYMILGFILIYEIRQMLYTTGFMYELLLPTVILISYPCIGTSIQRGNSSFVVALLISLFACWEQSESKFKEEASLLVLAVASCLKMYPAIIGLVLLKRKRYKAFVRFVVYTLILFFVPFAFWGGIQGIKDFIGILLEHNSWSAVGHYGSIQGFLVTSLRLDSGRLGIAVQMLFLIMSIAMFFISESRCKEMLFLCGILASFLAYNWAYTSVYYLPVFLLFLKEHGESCVCREKEKICYFDALILGIIFSIPSWMEFVFDGGCYEGVFLLTYIWIGINMCYCIYSFIIRMRRAK